MKWAKVIYLTQTSRIDLCCQMKAVSKVCVSTGLWAIFAFAVVGPSAVEKGDVRTYKELKWNWVLKTIKCLCCSCWFFLLFCGSSVPGELGIQQIHTSSAQLGFWRTAQEYLCRWFKKSLCSLSWQRRAHRLNLCGTLTYVSETQLHNRQCGLT